MEQKIQNEIIYMHKPYSEKDAVRINKEQDIPEFLKQNISLDGDKIMIKCVEGEESAPLGSVIAFEKSDTLGTGWNAWHKANAATTLLEKDGKFYNIPTIVEAAYISTDGTIPSIAEGAPVTVEGNTISVKTDWGVSSAQLGEAYFVKYGTKEDGTPDINILSLKEDSARQYIVCTKDMKDIMPLLDYHAKFVS